MDPVIYQRLNTRSFDIYCNTDEVVQFIEANLGPLRADHKVDLTITIKDASGRDSTGIVDLGEPNGD